MDLKELPKKYDLSESLLRTRASEREFISKLKPFHKKIYLFLYKVLIIGIFAWIVMLILFIFIRSSFVFLLFLSVFITNIALGIIRQRIRKHIKKKIKENKY